MRGNFSALAGLIILGLYRPYVSFSGGFQAVSGLIILIIPVTCPSPGTKAGQESKVYKKFIRSLFHGKCCIMVLI